MLLSVHQVQTGGGAIFNSSSLDEQALRDHEVSLRLELHGGALWSAEARRGELGGLRMTLNPGVSLRLLRAAVVDRTTMVCIHLLSCTRSNT